MQAFRGISHGTQDVLRYQLRILRYDLLNRQAIRQTTGDHSYRNAGTCNARLSMVNFGIGDDPLRPGIRFLEDTRSPTPAEAASTPLPEP